MTNDKNHLQWGFSIVELMVVLGIFAIMSLFLSYLAVYHFQTYNTETAELAVTYDARNALDDIANYVRQANRVLASYSTYATGDSTLVLQVQSIDASNQLIGGANDTVVYYLSGTTLMRQVFPNVASSRPATTTTLAYNINTADFSFAYDNATYSLAENITTTMAIQQTVGTEQRSITIISTSNLRNYQ